MYKYYLLLGFSSPFFHAHLLDYGGTRPTNRLRRFNFPSLPRRPTRMEKKAIGGRLLKHHAYKSLPAALLADTEYVYGVLFSSPYKMSPSRYSYCSYERVTRTPCLHALPCTSVTTRMKIRAAWNGEPIPNPITHWTTQYPLADNLPLAAAKLRCVSRYSGATTRNTTPQFLSRRLSGEILRRASWRLNTCTRYASLCRFSAKS